MRGCAGNPRFDKDLSGGRAYIRGIRVGCCETRCSSRYHGDSVAQTEGRWPNAETAVLPREGDWPLQGGKIPAFLFT